MLVKATNAAELRPILNAMLKELGESHFGVIPSSEDLEEQALIDQAEIDDAFEEHHTEEEKNDVEEEKDSFWRLFRCSSTIVRA